MGLLIRKFTTKRHKDAASKFLSELNNFEQEDNFDDWDIEEINTKLSEKLVVKLLKRFDPETNWTIQLVRDLLSQLS